MASSQFEAPGYIIQGNISAAMTLKRAALAHPPPKSGRVIKLSFTGSKMASTEPIVTSRVSTAASDIMADGPVARTGATFNSFRARGPETEILVTAWGTVPQPVVDSLLDQRRFAGPEEAVRILGRPAIEETQFVDGANLVTNGGNRLLLAAQG